jgi:hypothetical protein
MYFYIDLEIINDKPPTHHEKVGYCRINNMIGISYLGDARAAGAKPPRVVMALRATENHEYEISIAVNSKIGITPNKLFLYLVLGG